MMSAIATLASLHIILNFDSADLDWPDQDFPI